MLGYLALERVFLTSIITTRQCSMVNSCPSVEEVAGRQCTIVAFFQPADDSKIDPSKSDPLKGMAVHKVFKSISGAMAISSAVPA